MNTVRVRFAPSPTGHLHVGGARTAIFNWLFARHHQGTFIIRVEDTDQARSTRASEQMVLDDLRWLGLDWDEGPDLGGPHAPYRQSERMDVYERAARQLLGTAHAYRCFCREEELERKRGEAEAAGRPPHYDLTCFRLSPEESDARAASEPHVIRFHVPKEAGAAFDADVTIADGIRGEVTWKKESLGDFIILRSDGMPTYNFCVVVDDHEMEITHVIRAEEHLTNTHRQVLIYRAMGWHVPQFAHVSLILGQDRSKLSKRHGATSVSAYADDGFLPDAMVNYLTLLGWSHPDGAELFSRDEAISRFSLDRVNSAPAVFDAQKFLWVNAHYLHALDARELLERVSPRFAAVGIATSDPKVREWLTEAVDLVKSSAHTVNEIAPALGFVFHFDAERVLADADARSVLLEEGTPELIALLVDELRANGAPLDAGGYKEMTERLKGRSGAKGKKLFMPIRVALTGSPHGPELARSLPLIERASRISSLGVASPLARAEAVNELLQQSWI